MPSRRLSYGKIVQGERRTKQTRLFFMPSRRLSDSEQNKRRFCEGF